jgi:RNA polymerase sigma-70 factor (ECF subfamily)
MGPKNGVVALKHSAGNVLHGAARLRDGHDEPVPEAPPEARSAPATGASDARGSRGADGSVGGLPQSEPIPFAQVYKTQFDFVWRSLRLLGVPSQAIEDVTQDTFDIVSRQLAQFEGRSSLRTWLFSIAQRVAANHRRMARRKLSRLEPLTDNAASAEPTPQAHAEAVEAAGIVERFVEGLDADWRAVFVLSVLEGVPGSEVAEALGISVNAVYTRVHTLRESLRHAFEQHATRRPSKGLT